MNDTTFVLGIAIGAILIILFAASISAGLDDALALTWRALRAYLRRKVTASGPRPERYVWPLPSAKPTLGEYNPENKSGDSVK